MTAYTEPPTDQLARLAAEAMGWKWDNHYEIAEGPKDSGIYYTGYRNPWEPHFSHEHGQILVDEAFKRGLLINYYRALVSDDPPSHTVRTLLATPEQKTRAFLRAIHESKQWA